jgi:hypothetical protein
MVCRRAARTSTFGFPAPFPHVVRRSIAEAGGNRPTDATCGTLGRAPLERIIGISGAITFTCLTVWTIAPVLRRSTRSMLIELLSGPMARDDVRNPIVPWSPRRGDRGWASDQ